MKNCVTFFYCLLVFTIGGCDSAKLEPLQLLPSSSTEVVLTNGQLTAKLSKTGGLQSLSIDFGDSSPTPSRIAHVGSSVGLWLAGTQKGIKSNVGSDMLTLTLDKFEVQGQNQEGYGLYAVNKKEFELGYDVWPSDFGAPTYVDGSPKMLGDAMVWGVFGGISTSTNSFSEIRVVKTAYMFDDSELKNTVFVKYEISNLSSSSIEQLHLGFGADMDLNWSGFLSSDPPCGRQTPGWNYTGYNLDRNYSFTYMKPDSSDGSLRSDCYGILSGYTILGSSSDIGFSGPFLAHRVLTKSGQVPFEMFSAGKIQTPSQVLFALQGLSSEGAPMIDPTTGEPTHFAFTGDPVSETGWIDRRNEVRSLLSIAPVSLAPGESMEIIIPIFTTISSSFEEGFEDMPKQFDRIMAQRSRWDY